MSWYKLKKEVLRRDNFKCAFCGSEENLQVHHIIPKHRTALKMTQTGEKDYSKRFIFGDDDIKNLITLCKSCHTKGALLLSPNKQRERLLKNTNCHLIKCIVCGRRKISGCKNSLIDNPHPNSYTCSRRCSDIFLGIVKANKKFPNFLLHD